MKNIFFLGYMVIGLISSLITYFSLNIKSNEKKKLNFVNKFSNNCVKYANAEFIVENKHFLNIKEPYVLVANHESIFDLVAIYAHTNRVIGFISKKENKKIPILSLWMKEIGCVFIDRDNPRETVKGFNLAVENLEMGISMGIMPEGTRSTNDEEFKAGSFKIAQKAKATILPVTIRNTANLFENRQTIKKQKALIHYHQPIKYENYEHIELVDLAKQIQEQIHSVKF